MESLYILIPIAIVLVCIAVGIFLWAVKSEQFEDLERQGHNILFDKKEKAHNHSDSKLAKNEKANTESQPNLDKKNDDA